MQMESVDTVFLIAVLITHLTLITLAKVHVLLLISEIQLPTNASSTAQLTLQAIFKLFKTLIVAVTQAVLPDNIVTILTTPVSAHALHPRSPSQTQQLAAVS